MIRRSTRLVEAPLIVAFCLAALLVRPSLVADVGIGALGLVYAAIFGVALSVSMRIDERQLHPAVVLAVGMIGVALVRGRSGLTVPVHVSAIVIVLNTAAAVAEEAFFRRYLYGVLSRWGAPLAIGGSALVFAAVHVPAYGTSAFAVDLGAGLLLSWQRWSSGSWTVPAATHAAANISAVIR